MSFTKHLLSPAKINLGLTIPFKYANGFHHIVSIFVPIDLCDEVTVSISPSNSGDDHFELSWENHLPENFRSQKTALAFSQNVQDNLVYKAWQWIRIFLRQCSMEIAPLNVRVFVKKKIPSPGGLGGASSNAACLLQAVMEYIKPGAFPGVFSTIENQLKTRSLEIGSDVPFFLHNGPCLVSGTGEVFSEIQSLPFLGILATPDFGIATSGMFQALNKPVCRLTREEMIRQIPWANNSKKTLHDDYSKINSLKSSHEKYFGFLNWMTGAEKKNPAEFTGHTGMAGKFADIFDQEGNRTFLIKNEFIEVLQKVNPENYAVLKKLKNIFIRKTKGLMDEDNRTFLLTSMSGSGSTWYAGFPGLDCKHPFYNKIDVLVDELRKEHPGIYWQKFCSR
ncbi:MAG: hypothetical protein OEV66_05860 [Spirochaetia bacterium]|nr:hypothetical protein [Spirochaetia bacterium]